MAAIAPEQGVMEEWRMVNGVRTFSRVAGVGEDVVLIHGAGVSSTYWLRAQRLLAATGRYRVWAPDLPGFGRSENPAWPPELPRLAAHLEAWIDAALPGPCHLIGQSLGCEIALRVCVARPERVWKLVLAAPAGLPHLRSLTGQILRAAVDAFREPLELFPAILPDYLRFGPIRLLRLLWEQKRCDSGELLRQVRCPALVVSGVRDAVVSSVRVMAVASWLPKALALPVDGAHGAHYTHAGSFVETVDRYLCL